jgi:hypothetical protein
MARCLRAYPLTKEKLELLPAEEQWKNAVQKVEDEILK